MITHKTPARKRSRVPAPGQTLVDDIRGLIASARAHVATTANATLTLLYWRVGQRVRSEVLGSNRAAYGEEIVVTLSRQLSMDHGTSFDEKNLRRMIQFAEVFPDEQIVVSLLRELSWSHFVSLLPLKAPLQREFYAEMCRAERWSVRTLRDKIGGMLYERTALSRKPAELARLELAALRDEDRLSTDMVLRDPYLLDFLGLKDTYQEKDLEAAILREMERFIMELGSGFAFLARQKRVTLDGEDFYMDLLFYQRELRRLVVVELKLDRFRPEHKGQMELYLRWLDKYEQDRRGATDRHHPVHGQRPGPHRTAGARQDRHSRGGVPHCSAPEGCPATQAAGSGRGFTRPHREQECRQHMNAFAVREG